ncbi:MAG: mechanosensitive ion channel [Parcubacteria group bacterium]|nr:mechanosensitive ion channel [Parcubacteria group bacterium]
MFLATVLNASGEVVSISEQLTSWFFSHGIKVLIILIVTWFISRFVKIFLSRFLRKVVKKSLDLGKKSTIAEEERAKTVVRVIVSVIKVVVWVLAVLIILPEFGVNIAPLLAGLGVIGLALGFGSRTLIQDYISGLFILLEDQFRVGEDIEIAGVHGIVSDFNLRRTAVRDKDSVLHFVSNNQIKKVSNFSRKK